MRKLKIRLTGLFGLVLSFGFVCNEPISNYSTDVDPQAKTRDTVFGVDTIVDFKLKSVDGKMVSLSDYPEAKGFIIVFTCNHCPFARLYSERLKKLSSEFVPRQIPLIAISSTDTVQYEEDAFIKMKEKARKENFNFPYLYDHMQVVAKNFNAQKTPHAFIIWKEEKEWRIRYSGAIDDNGAAPEKVKRAYVKEAVNALLKGENIETQLTKSIGCQIYWRAVSK